MIRSLFYLLNSMSDAIVKGNWTLVLIVVAVCLAFVFIYANFSNGKTGISGAGVVAILCVFSFFVLMKLARNDDIHHPEKYVGHTYELASRFVLAATTEDGVLSCDTGSVRAKRALGGFGYVSYSHVRDLNVVNLAHERPGKSVRLFERSEPTRLTVVASSRASGETPLVEVRAENNAYAGGLYWISAKRLSESDCTMSK